MKKLLLFIIVQSLISLSAYADVFSYPVKNEDIANIEKTIPQPKILKTDFRQTKKINGLQKDLNSSGKMIYAKEKGFYWKINKPFEVTYIFTPKGLIQIENDEKKLIPAESNAFFNEFSGILQSIFSGKYEQLSKHFDVFFVREGKRWTLGLRPTNKTVKGVITEISVTGSQNTENILFKESNGDSTKIQLYNLGKSQLTDAENNYFNY